MKFTTRLFAIGIATAVLATLTPAVSLGKTTGTTEDGAVPAQELRVRYWHLRQNSGAELYQELCASCHGVDGAGRRVAVGTVMVPAPALTDLKRGGIPEAHWGYALNSACEDSHHWTGNAHETMPCWRRVFRQALGSDAASFMVNKKLVDYLALIQD